ncbi:hypothetical protein pmac_cds_493 [Pandoravirus macleodensis]|uniref:Uncharacterized protein n=1 Tax=Pandoravirus macleodensis TaxID=2107707 RepID=A0A2U7UGN7_9VIRU|nr:hypothetical protein pmac_cds_493 [Pandoravirus macleodensis]AVK77181.1 hypothetical protein pmac_cds_493 [Pandoravirus macleodensis]
MASTTSSLLRELLSHPTIATFGVSAALCTTVSYGAYTWYKTYELSVRARVVKDHLDFLRDLTALPRATGGESSSSTDGRAVNFEGMGEFLSHAVECNCGMMNHSTFEPPKAQKNKSTE